MSSRINLPHGDGVVESSGHGNRVRCKCLQINGCGPRRLSAARGAQKTRWDFTAQERTDEFPK